MRVVVTSLIFCAIIGCMDSTKVAPKINELGVTTNLESLTLGRSVYINKCTKCHNALRITRYSNPHWDEILPEMIYKAKLSKNEANAVTDYIRIVLNTASSSLTGQPSQNQ